MKRKKRLEKGIESMEKQRKIHEEKLTNAKSKEDLNLEDYHNREIISKKKDLEKKRKLLNR